MIVLKLSTSLLIGMEFLAVSFSNCMEFPFLHSKEQEQWKALVKDDYMELRDFSSQEKLYDLTEESFKRMLWNGLLQALDFYQSSKGLNSHDVNGLIHHELALNSNLQHAIPVPMATKANKGMAFKALNSFSGIWHGNWRSQKMHHNWLPVRNHIRKITEDVMLLGFQSCFTGDGIGWNYVVKKGNDVLILGFVYHMGNDGSLVSGNPHFAFLNTNQQLTWVSDNHIYYEYTHDNLYGKQGKQYVITGASYKNGKAKPTLISGFQAIYVSNKLELPKFQTLALKDEHPTSKTKVKTAKKETKFPISLLKLGSKIILRTLNNLYKIIPMPKLVQHL